MIAPLLEQKALPHSEESERAVLAAILLDPTRHLPTTSGRLRPNDFYLERHQRLYEAMLELQDDKVEIDIRTLQAHLEQKKLFQEVGGLAYIATLEVDLPDLGRVEHYVEIVKERSLRRRLIAACSDIYRNCQDGGLDAKQALDRAEQAILELGEQATPRGFITLGEAIKGTVFDLEERPDQLLTGLPSGFDDWDALTHGLNAGSLIIIAGRPGMGKSSFSTNVAQSLALKHDKSIGIFSLEMSVQEIAMRILASEAEVPLRKRRPSDRDWDRIHRAARRIADARIFIDDSASPTLLEVASKARRLKLERGLDLLILDYLQLMQAGGRYENRNLEIGAITRGLKGLAKELSIPVIALSQLSRQPERRGSDHRPQLADLRESGCLAGETLVPLDSGVRLPIRELAGRSEFAIWALNQHSLRIEQANVSRAFATGLKPVYRLVTRLGRVIRATANHKFLSIGGWTRLDQLRSGHHIALPRHVPTSARQSLSDLEAALLGHLIGDGCTLPRHAIQYTTREEDLARTVADLATAIFGTEVRPRVCRERSWFQVYLTSTRRHTHGCRSAVAEWLEAFGIWGLRSHEKHIPEKLFEQPRETIERFLRHLWATDGCIRLPRNGVGYPAIYYATSSCRLAQDVQSLLLKIGLRARVEVHPQRGKGRDQYHVRVSGRSEVLRFAERVGAVGAYKTASLADAVAWLEAREENTNRDVIPKDVWDLHVRPAMRSNGVTHRQLHANLGMAYGGMTIFKQNLSRERALRVARAAGAEALDVLAASDIYWDQIASIQPDGIEEVFDLTVPGPHNFIANDVFVHNSIEQDADLVAFIYRDEVYNPEVEESHGTAELIVAKNRNGQTGVVDLAFFGETTTFRSRAYQSPP